MGASYCDIFPYVYELYFNFVPKKSPPPTSSKLPLSHQATAVMPTQRQDPCPTPP